MIFILILFFIASLTLFTFQYFHCSASFGVNVVRQIIIQFIVYPLRSKFRSRRRSRKIALHLAIPLDNTKRCPSFTTLSTSRSHFSTSFSYQDLESSTLSSRSSTTSTTSLDLLVLGLEKNICSLTKKYTKPLPVRDHPLHHHALLFVANEEIII